MNAVLREEKIGPGRMSAVLRGTLLGLPLLLDNREAWDSLIVNRRKPTTYRVYSNRPGGVRVCLHKFDECDDRDAFPHPHPWPAAFVILQGRYRMRVGDLRLKDGDEYPVAASFELGRHSMYEMCGPQSWHAVSPLETTYTVMVNGPPFGADAHPEVRTTRGKDLDKMPEDELRDHLEIFKTLVKDWAEAGVA